MSERSGRARRGAAAAAAEALTSGTERRAAQSTRRVSEKRKNPVESDSELSELSEDDTPAPKRVRERPPGGARVDVAELGDNELFNAVLGTDVSLEEAAENWVVAFQGEPLDALAQLVTFLFRLCGCDASISRDQVAASDTLANTLEEIQTAFAQNAVAQYPIVSRAKTMRPVRKNASALLERLLHDAAEAEVVSDDDFLDTLQAWLTELAQSPLRSFRHTGTVVTMWVLGALSAQLETARDSYDVAERQRDTEAKKTGANRTRLAHTSQRMEQLDAVRDTLDAHIDDLVSSVFVPRVRDVDAAIRLDCIEQLGALLKEYPTQYLQEFYFRHLGAALSDPDASVRLRALRAVQGVCVEAHAEALKPFADAHKKRMVDMALYDLDLGVRTAAFAVLEAANEYGMLSNDDCSLLAVHVFDVDAKIRVAAAAFVFQLLQHEGRSDGQIRALIALLVKYNEQLEELESRNIDEHVQDDVALLRPNLGRIGVVTEALWDAVESLHAWQPYLDVLLDTDADLSQAEEGVAVEMLVTAVRLTRERGIEEDGVLPIEACSHALIPALPKLLARFSAETQRIADLLLLVQHMDLGVYHETRNMSAFEGLWDDVCLHFMRHVEARLLQNAAEALQHLASAPAAVSTQGAKLATLRETVVATLQETLHQRTIDTALFTEDDVYGIHASLARLHALMKAMDVAVALDDTLQDTPYFTIVLRLALRGRLDYEQERPFVQLALQTLTLYLLWRSKEALQDETLVEQIRERRDELLPVLQSFLDTQASATKPLIRTALQCSLMLYSLYAALSTDDEAQAQLHLACPESVQHQCANALYVELEQYVPLFRADVEQNTKPRGPRRAPRASILPGTSLRVLHTGLELCSLAAAYVTAVRVGALDVKHSAALLRYYAHFNGDYDALCHDLVAVLRDDAMHADRAWIVCESILDTLKKLFLLYADEGSEAHFVALSRQLANATMIRGPGFSVVQAVEPDAMVTLHVAGIQQVLQYIQDGTGNKGHEPAFFKGLSNLLATVSSTDAMKM